MMLEKTPHKEGVLMKRLFSILLAALILVSCSAPAQPEVTETAPIRTDDYSHAHLRDG